MLIIHVTVAYNCPEELELLLESIGVQEEEEHHIICVDNSNISSKAENRLLCQSFNTKQNYHIEYFPLSKNYGSATGFAIGMTIGYKEAADYIWLHDQDGHPLPNCLHEMQRYLAMGTSILSPKILDQNDEYLSPFHGNYDRYMNKFPVTFNGEFTWAEVAGTAGLLIKRDIIDKIGVYDYHDYFTGNEDFDYCLRSMRLGNKVCVVKDAQYYHPNKQENNARFTPIRNYFGEINASCNTYEAYQDLFYYIKFYRHNFLFTYFYSIVRVLIKKIILRPIYLRPTLKCYFHGFRSRYLSYWRKTIIDPTIYLE
ncbi:MAG: glycosyltransferase [Bacteroidales bacterium]|nr:glycosyltransferase [Bacteroidales bacterium]